MHCGSKIISWVSRYFEKLIVFWLMLAKALAYFLADFNVIKSEMPATMALAIESWISGFTNSAASWSLLM